MSSPGYIASLFPILGIGATTAATGSSADITPHLATTADGTVLRGTAAGRTVHGTVIHTEKGEITIQTDIFLKRGVEVAIQLEKKQQDMFARLITIDGKSVAKYLEAQAQQAPSADDTIRTTAPLPPAASGTAASQGQQAAPTRLEAVLLSRPMAVASPSAPSDPKAASPTSPAPPVMQQAVPGSRITIEVVSLAFPASPAALSTAPPTVPPSPLPNPPMPAPVAASPERAAPIATSLAATTASVIPPLPSPSGQVSSTAPTGAPPAPLAALPHATPVQMQGLAVYQRLTQNASPPMPATASPASSSILPPLTDSISTPAATLTPSSSLPADMPLAGSARSTSSPAASAMPAAAASVPAAPVLSPSPAPIASASPPAMPSIPTPAPLSEASTASSLPPVPAMPPVVASPPAASTVAPPAATPIAPPPSPTITATIIGSSGPGELILQTSAGSLKLMNTSPLPIGTSLQIRITEVAPPHADSADPAVAELTAQRSPAGSLAAMEEYAALPAAAGQTASISGALPKPGKEMLSEILFLFSALKSGDVRRWLGSRSDELDASGKADLLGRLSADFASLRPGGEAREPQAWNTMVIPFLHGGQVEPVRLFYKRHRKDPARLQDGDSEHFLLDMQLTQLGHFQLDGLVKKQRPLSFDLIVRSEAPLGTAMEADIRTIYNEAAQTTGFQGTLLFRHGSHACVPPPIMEPQGVPEANSIIV